MYRLRRLLVAFVIVLSGSALVPYVALPSEQFSWERFTGVYGGDPALICNYTEGRAGSSFACVATDFAAEEEVTISIRRGNGPWKELTTLTTSEIGTLDFIIETPDNLGNDDYMLKVEGSLSAETSLSISGSAPVREQEGDAPVVEIPELAVGNTTFMPVITE